MEIHAHRHLCVVCILVRRDTDSCLNTALDVTFVGIHLHELRPRLLRVPRSVKASLVSLLRLLFMMQAKTQVSQDLPLETCLTVCHMLRFEMSHFGSEYRPY